MQPLFGHWNSNVSSKSFTYAVKKEKEYDYASLLYNYCLGISSQTFHPNTLRML